MIFVFLFVLSFFVFLIASLWRIFEKAGEPGWAAIIPIYNGIIMLKIVGKPWWWIFLFVIPGVSYVFSIWTANMLSKSFGKDEGFTVGLVLLFFIFYPILGFGDAEYQGPFGDPAAYNDYQLRKNGNRFDFDTNL